MNCSRTKQHSKREKTRKRTGTVIRVRKSHKCTFNSVVSTVLSAISTVLSTIVEAQGNFDGLVPIQEGLQYL